MFNIHPSSTITVPALAMWQHVVELEDGEDAPPIMEIREWLDESGNQTSVDVTDLGKVRSLFDQLSAGCGCILLPSILQSLARYSSRKLRTRLFRSA